MSALNASLGLFHIPFSLFLITFISSLQVQVQVPLCQKPEVLSPEPRLNVEGCVSILLKKDVVLQMASQLLGLASVWGQVRHAPANTGFST